MFLYIVLFIVLFSSVKLYDLKLLYGVYVIVVLFSPLKIYFLMFLYNIYVDVYVVELIKNIVNNK